MPLRRPDYLNDPGQGFIGQQLDALFPGATGLLGLMNIKPDRDIWNALAGSPYAYQQSAMGGNNSMLDIRMHEARKAFKLSLDADADEELRQSALQGYYRVLGFDSDTSRERAEQRYSPTGLLSSFAMKSFEFDSGRENLTQGFLEMNLTPITPGVIDERTMGGEYVARQRRQQEAAREFSTRLERTYAADPSQFGNLTYGETGEVFAQMASRDTLNIRNLTNVDGSANETRIQETTRRVQEMSRAVEAMQDLFGGSIPEVFDKLDAVFGGSASAMGGREIESRVRELEQLSSVSGQSIQATAQMIQVGQQYAKQAGFDPGIGTAAAMQTTAQIGVNVDSSGFNMRRVNMGRVRALALRNNVAAGTSPFAQQYAGAQQIYMAQQRAEGREDATDEELSREFFDLTSGVRTLSGLADVTGATRNQIQLAGMGEDAQIAMSDNEFVMRAAGRGDIERETSMVGNRVFQSLRNRADMDITVEEADIFEEVDGQRIVRGREDIIERVLAREENQDLTVVQQEALSGVVNSAIQEGARVATGSRINASEFAVRQRQQVGAPRLRQLAQAQAQFETDMAEFAGPGGFMGIMNFLSDASFGEEADQLEGLDKAQLDAMAGFKGKNYEDLTDKQKAVYDSLPPEVQERYRSQEPESRIEKVEKQTAIYNDMSEMARERYEGLDVGQRQRLTQKRETVGGFVRSFLGGVDPDSSKRKENEIDARSFVTSAINAYNDDDTDSVTKERLGVIFNALSDQSQLRNLNKDDREEAAELIRSGIGPGDDREKNIKRLSYLLGTDKFRAREDLKGRLDTAGADFEDFDMTSEERQRDAIVKASLVNKAGALEGTKFKTTKELESFLLEDDESLSDIKEKLKLAGVSEEAQKSIVKDLDRFNLAIGSEPSKPDLTEVLQKLVNVLNKLESNQGP